MSEAGNLPPLQGRVVEPQARPGGGGPARPHDASPGPSHPVASRPPSPEGEGEVRPRPDLSRIDAWIFDLDDTLYPPEQGLLQLVQTRINAFMVAAVGLPEDQAYVLQRQFLDEHGTTLAGLMANYTVDPDKFLHEVHDVPMDSVEPNPTLRALIDGLPGRKFVLTNGARDYAGRVIARLGFEGLFDGMWAIEDMDLTPKPAPATFRRFIETFAIDPARAIFFEDTPRNLEPAKAMGMTTVLIGDGRGHPVGPWIDARATDLQTFLEPLAVKDAA